MTSTTDDEAQRLHTMMELTAKRLAGVLEDARFERRDGYTFMAFPMLRIRAINGVWADTDAAADHLEDALAEAEELGAPFAVTVRAGRTPAVEEAARQLGFTSEERVPGMVAGPDDLGDPPVRDIHVIRVETADGLAQALSVAATSFGVPAEIPAAMYGLEVAELEGFHYYLGRVGERDVATAAGFTIEGTVGIFNVATLPADRGRGYGAAITARAARDGFDSGADLAGLQSSLMGESMYSGLGFREVETYTLFMRPR